MARKKIKTIKKIREIRSTLSGVQNIFKSKKGIAGVVVIVMMVAVLTVYFYDRYHTYDHYKVMASVKINSTDNSRFVSFGEFAVKYSNDGISYIDGEEVVWDEAYEMKAPIVDVCESYLAIADKNTNDIYIYDETGRRGKVSVRYPIIKLQVAKQGVVAALQQEGEANYIEAYDIEGKLLIAHKALIDERGYPLNFSLSDDGSNMMVSYLSVDNGTFKNKIVFYDFSVEGKALKDRISGSFEQYQETIVPLAEYVSDEYAVAVGENIISIYDIREKPQLEKEVKINHKIEKIFWNEEYIGITYNKKDDNSEHYIEVYSMKGRKKFEGSTRLNFERIDFAGDNILLCDDLNCELISFHKVRKFQHTFQGSVREIIPLKSFGEFLLMTNSEIQKIRLK